MGNQVLIDEVTLRAEPLSLLVKGRKDSVLAYPVLAMGELQLPREREGVMLDVSIEGQCWGVTGGQVEPRPHPCRIEGLKEYEYHHIEPEDTEPEEAEES